MAHVPTIRTVERLAAREETPEPLRSWLLEECRWLDSDPTTRALLCAALEGLHGIPTANRDTTEVPLWAGAELCRRVLSDLAPWWDVDRRAKQALGARDSEDFAQLLSAWSTYRVTFRHLQKQALLSAKVVTANSLPLKTA